MLGSIGVGSAAKSINLFLRSTADPSVLRGRRRMRRDQESEDEWERDGAATLDELTTRSGGEREAGKVYALEDETDFDFDHSTGAPLLPAHARLHWEYLGAGHFRHLPVDAPRNREGWLEARRRARKTAMDRLHTLMQRTD